MAIRLTYRCKSCNFILIHVSDLKDHCGHSIVIPIKFSLMDQLRRLWWFLTKK